MTTDTRDEIDDEILEDMETFIYVERATKLIYEARLFDGFVLVRPVTPAFYSLITKLSHNDFNREYEEYQGDHDVIRNIIWGGQLESVLEVS